MNVSEYDTLKIVFRFDKLSNFKKIRSITGRFSYSI